MSESIKKVDLSTYRNRLSLKNKLGRLSWNIAYTLLFRPFCLPFFNGWRVFLLNCFGAKIDRSARINASVRIWAPWQLEVHKNTWLGPRVNCYNTARIIIGENTIVSHGAYLCPGSHDITKTDIPLIAGEPMIIEDQVWICTEAFVGGLGVHIGQGAVIGARACVFRNVEKWSVVGGNPATFIKKRVLE